MITEPKALPLAESMHQDLQDRASALFFERSERSGLRPDPHDVAGLIQEGLTEDMIITAARAQWRAIPEMPKTLHDLDIVLPYYQRMSDRLASEHPHSSMIFAARDGEVVADDFAITHPEIPSHLLPATMGLWESSGMADDRLAAKFLGRYGLDAASVERPPMSIVVVDAGYHGSVGKLLAARLTQLYGASTDEVDELLKNKTITVRLIHTNPGAIGREIMDISETGRSLGLQRLDLQASYITEGSATGVLADFAQTLPRFNQRYANLETFGDDVFAVTSDYYATRNGSYTSDVDRPASGNSNDSIVSPVAAAIVQFRVVGAALARRKQSS